MSKTLFDKVWDSHIVKSIPHGPDVLYIDRHFIHEVTSPVAFLGLKNRGVSVFRPQKTLATADHNTPTIDQHLPVKDELSAKQLAALTTNTNANSIDLWGLGHEKNGIVHVIGPEYGITQPGMTIVCGDSHTSTHGAFGSIAFGIGTSEVEMVLATQCVLQPKPKKMRITIDGKLGKGVTAKDLILYVISQTSTSGATGYFVEYAGSAIKSLSMEGRMTVCNMSIEMGARGGIIAPDETTFEYLEGKEFAPKGKQWDKALAYWKSLPTEEGATFDKEYHFKAEDISPMVTYGTNPGMGIGINAKIPTIEEQEADEKTYLKSLNYMGFNQSENIAGKKVDYVFLGSCTNSRIEDMRAFASIVKGRKKSDDITVWVVPGSRLVLEKAKEEGIIDILEESGFDVREPGCSACLAMNDDKIPAGKYAVSTSNRNFEGRQGPGARTLLASPLTAAATAITGVLTDPREFI